MTNTLKVRFDPAHMYTRRRRLQRPKIMQGVRKEAPKWALEAVIVCGWHKSFSDSRIHITVDYVNGTKRVAKRFHVYPWRLLKWQSGWIWKKIPGH
ncbi:hypothetical protein AUEXF2481DRAFT_9657 [Aureobasidium subglaciale EXF-2481]|uniref:Uncharacterized protein n=1 Tax=Aureobasidium subglaciale (strain EXF-2481) TaxID=1043005 RepID=A0A074YTN6_AURSE|nr:uncharacterized protein AUEXF2481DRAFT_9657 [Aureobasidium subglaciale EXF-2481]KAI5205226.1 hypothetical protein E4T38_04342 [Aureobasidium subglaciale]KAI5224141.1 hypothetical protein E4T40_04118 [Aureobasidium subglaciale]KAI5228309.1 hypothetical protein E4T41_03879 [Aureobasidium subglaciale]KAI5262892.1 hypothetical protein E4T46_04086 [Aureobasidium subglaciale]KEQ90186.1 hypothetical protein AUEXF2481DRAFT_9657 [Aureobasidium subglaciale EXF-2481]